MKFFHSRCVLLSLILLITGALSAAADNLASVADAEGSTHLPGRRLRASSWHPSRFKKGLDDEAPSQAPEAAPAPAADLAIAAPFGFGTTPEEVRKLGCTIIFAAFFASKPDGFKRAKGERCNGCHEAPMHITFDSARITHPGACTAVLTDMETDLTQIKGIDEMVQVHRFANVIDREQIGKPGLMFERMKTYRAFVDRAMNEKFEAHLVLLDTDIVLIENIAEVFAKDFDYGLSVRPDNQMPIQGGVQLVHREHMAKAASFLRLVEEAWLEKAEKQGQKVIAFTGDQRIYTDVVGSTKALVKLATAKGISFMDVAAGGEDFKLEFLPAHKYNRTPGGPGSGLKAEGVKVLHYKGGRKEKMFIPYNALRKGGLKAVYNLKSVS